jgi:23S rRNA pseudouridine1911/1915/1917 synthase
MAAHHPPPSSKPLGPAADQTWKVPPELHARPLDGVIRALTGGTWSEARRLIDTGKVAVAGEVVTQGTRKVRAGDQVELRLRAPRPRVARALELDSIVVHVDPSVVVVRKPAGISTVPYGDEDPADDGSTLDALVRDVVARRDAIRGRAPLGVVQRLDKVTSGLIVFARTFAAKKHLAAQLRQHTMHRLYLAIVHGDMPAATLRSHLVADRGDGRRGSSERALPGRRRPPRGRGDAQGQLAVTHVSPRERLRGATLVACRLETGRTHQIRIHLSEAGHPLVGEKVYCRADQGEMIAAPRLMLHAAELGFVHPADDRPMRFEEPPPADFEETLARLRR